MNNLARSLHDTPESFYDSSMVEEAKRHILFHHNPKNTQGFITLAKKDARTGHFHQYHYRAEELAAHLSEWTGENVYFSQNTFYRPQRRLENIKQLRSLYVDLDTYNQDLTNEQVIGLLEMDFFRQSIPEPNIIIHSGRGLVLVWLIEPVPSMAVPLWTAVQKYLLDQLKEFGGDSKCVDASRIFRVAGTINAKSGAHVEAEMLHDYRYGLREIQEDYLPDLTPKVNEKGEKKLNGRKKVVRLYNTYSLHFARLQDITRLVELRNYDMTNYREITCFLYRYWECCFDNDPQEALRRTLELNASFTYPLPQSEVIRSTRSAEKAWEAKNSKEAKEIAKQQGFGDSGYNFTNKKLIAWLDITREEMTQLSTIIDAAEKRRRRTLARRANGIRPMEEYNEERREKKLSKVEEMQQHLAENPKISNVKLGKLMGISESYVRKLKKSIQ